MTHTQERERVTQCFTQCVCAWNESCLRKEKARQDVRFCLCVGFYYFRK